MYTLGHDFMPPADPRRRAALPRHGADPVPPVRPGPDRGGGLPADRGLRGGGAVRAHRGHLPAPETAHAIHAAIDEALRCSESGEAKTIVFNLSGHGHFDLVSYEKYFAGKLADYEYPEELIRQAQASLPVV